MWEFKGRNVGPEFDSQSLQFCEKRILFLTFQTKPYILSLCLFFYKIVGKKPYIFSREQESHYQINTIQLNICVNCSGTKTC